MNEWKGVLSDTKKKKLRAQNICEREPDEDERYRDGRLK